jgi:glycosyltransferase involved in cell wall biosynthesis
MPKVSVILPCYNGAQWIDAAVRSVLCQTYKDLELIVVDDGSTDNSKDIVLSHSQDDRLRYIHQRNRGFSAANNTGLKESEGEFIGFIGQDDLWMPNKLRCQVEYLERHKRVDLVHSDLYHIDSSGRTIKRRNPRIPRFSSNSEYVKELFLRNFLCFQTVLVRRECFNEVGSFDERMIVCSDHDLWLRMAGKFKMAYIKKPLVKKRYHPKQLMKVRKEAAIKDEFLLTKKAVAQYPFLERYIKRKMAELYYVWGVALLEKGNKKSAREKFLQAIKYHPWKLKAVAIYCAPTLYKIVLDHYAKIEV